MGSEMCIRDRQSHNSLPGNYATAVQLAEIPEQIRGFDVVKKRHVEVAEKNRQELLERFRTVEDNISHQQPVEEVIN